MRENSGNTSTFPHLPTDRHPAPTNTLMRRTAHTTSITVPLALAHLVAIKLHATPTHAQIREHRVNALLSARRAPHDNQLLRRPQRLVPHGLTHLRYSYYIMGEDMGRDLGALQREGLACQICASHLDGTDMEPAIDILDCYGEYGNLTYPGDMIVYADGVLYETIPEGVHEAVKAAS